MRKTFTLFGLTQVFEVDHGGLGGWPRRVATSDQIRSDQDKIHFLIQLDIRHNMDHFSEKFLSLSTSIYPFISELLLSLCWPFCFTLRSFFLLVSILLLCLLSFFLSLYLVLSNLWLSLSVFAFCVRNFFLSFSLQSLTLSLSLSLSQCLHFVLEISFNLFLSLYFSHCFIHFSFYLCHALLSLSLFTTLQSLTLCRSLFSVCFCVLCSFLLSLFQLLCFKMIFIFSKDILPKPLLKIFLNCTFVVHISVHIFTLRANYHFICTFTFTNIFTYFDSRQALQRWLYHLLTNFIEYSYGIK